jgi:hypothetical protein
MNSKPTPSSSKSGSSPYTPTGARVRSAYVESRRHETSYQHPLADHGDEFERWQAAQPRTVSAEQVDHILSATVSFALSDESENLDTLDYHDRIVRQVIADLGITVAEAGETSKFVAVDERAEACKEVWPGSSSGEYDPRCCRFPKSCSAGYYGLRHVAEAGEVR